MNASIDHSHYLAPDVGKISASSPLPSPSLLDSFSSDFILESSTAIDPADVYNRSTQSIPASPFTYNHLGSPIESYSPSSDHSTSTGFDFIDTSNDLIMSYESEGGASIESTGRPWAIDPRFAEFSQDRAEDGIKAESEDGIAQSSRSTPRIVVKPASLRRASVPVIEEEDEEEEDRIIKDEEMDSDGETYNSIPLPSLSKSAPPAPVVLLKKKRTPKLAKTSVDKFATAELHITSSRSHLAPVPDWTDKPDPDAYKALGSKEKRQLRNKISARNFRHRRKENFNSLEEGITTRDTVIVELREEVAVLRQDNSALKQEVDSMKKQWAEMMAKMTNLSVSSLTSNVPGLGLAATPTAPSSIKSLPARRLTSLPPLLLASLPPLPPLPFASAASNDDWPLASPPIASGSGSRTRAVVKIAKDVAPGSKRATGSWTTSMGTGRYMPVHTMYAHDPRIRRRHISNDLVLAKIGFYPNSTVYIQNHLILSRHLIAPTLSLDRRCPISHHYPTKRHSMRILPQIY